MPTEFTLPGLILYIVLFIMSVVVHEVAHGFIAFKLGDPTAFLARRLTLNPIRHIDPFMSILMPALIFIASGGRFMFGGAKPVPVNPYRFARFRRGMMLTAIAGPLSNILIALALALVLIPATYLRVASGAAAPTFVETAFVMGILTNIILAFFNMIPIPPLDGSRVLAWILPPNMASHLDRIESFGIMIVMLLVFTRAFTPIFQAAMYLTALLASPAWILAGLGASS